MDHIGECFPPKFFTHFGFKKHCPDPFEVGAISPFSYPILMWSICVSYLRELYGTKIGIPGKDWLRVVLDSQDSQAPRRTEFLGDVSWERDDRVVDVSNIAEHLLLLSSGRYSGFSPVTLKISLVTAIT